MNKLLVYLLLAIFSVGFAYTVSSAVTVNVAPDATLIKNVEKPLAFPAAQPADIQCGDYLYTNTELTHDLTCTFDKDGLIFKANNIILDCKGHTITGNCSAYWSYGIWITNHNGTSIVNCTVKNFCEGIWVENSDRNSVLYSSIQSNALDGIYITNNSDSNLLFANNLTNNPEVGLKIDLNSTNNAVVLNTFYNDKRAVVIDRAGYNNVTSNLIENNTYYGILLSGSGNNRFDSNRMKNNTYGIRFWTAGSSNKILNNTIENGLNYGIYIYNTTGCEITRNNLINDSYGMYFNHAYSLNVFNNTAKNNSNYGIYMESDTGVSIVGNYVCSNKEDIRDLNSNSGVNNSCQTTYNWNDDGVATGCTHNCTHVCGDANYDAKVTVADVVYLINYLFKGGPAPMCMPYTACADVNLDGKLRSLMSST